MDDLIKLPKKITEINLQQFEQQENPFTGQEEKMLWQCRVSDTCPLDGTWNKYSQGIGETQQEAYDEAIKIFFDE